jgi:HSP20 family protein
MAIVKVDPFRELAAMQDRMARLFGDVYLRDEDTGFRGNWTPAVDIFETENHDLVLKAELPGMTREDIEITVENGTLVLPLVHAAEHGRHVEGRRRLQERHPHREAAVPRGSEAADDQRRSDRVMFRAGRQRARPFFSYESTHTTRRK